MNKNTENIASSIRKSRGNAYFKSEKILEAIDEYTKGIESNPSDPLFYCNRSLAYLKLNQVSNAKKDAETVIQLLPTWPKGYYRKGQAEESVGAYDEAIKSYSDGLKMCQQDAVLFKALENSKLNANLLRERRKSITKFSCILSVLITFCCTSVDITPLKFIDKIWQRWLLLLFCVFITYSITTSYFLQKQKRILKILK